ncbi:hypothetical protein HanHA300_Chr06g0218141 [Helianthus annuus]|nr:hypothetical protein HanHA300_Chr06g0218141 [Helianthus annuus]
MVPLSSDLSQSPALVETEIELMEHSSMKPSVTKLNPTSDNYNSNCDVEQAACVNIDIKVNGSGCLSHHALGEELSVENSKQLPLSTSVNEVAADNCFLNSGNNSAISKSKLESPKSSARKSYSARFTVRRDLVRGQTLVVDSPIMDLCQTTNTAKEISLAKQEDSERGSSNQEGTASSNTLPPNSLSPNRIASQSNSSSSSSKSTEIKDQQVCDMIRNEKHNIFDACIEALRSLDASSKTALEVCSRLRDVTSTHENSAEASEAQFCAEAAVMLPSIARNVQEIVKFASSCGVGKVDIPGFEPLLGKFAESLSQRVIELLKESCTSS